MEATDAFETFESSSMKLFNYGRDTSEATASLVFPHAPNLPGQLLVISFGKNRCTKLYN
jgi:hypothetical protein